MKSTRTTCLFLACLLLHGAHEAGAAQFWGRSSDVVLTRIRPADVVVRDVALSIEVNAAGRGAGVAMQLRELVRSQVFAGNSTLREDESNPDLRLQCAIVKYAHQAKWETRQSLLSGSSRVQVVQAEVEVAYTLVDARNGRMMDGAPLRSTLSRTFSEGNAVSDSSALADDAIKNVAKDVAGRIADLPVSYTVRLMKKGKLGDYASLAMSGEWLQYMESISALPEKPKDKSFEGDRSYDMGIAYEALAYEALQTDPDKADRYLTLSEQYFREAQQKDPKEKEYSKGFGRLAAAQEAVQQLMARKSLTTSGPSVGGKSLTMESEASASLNNATIIEMSRAKLGDDVIVAALQQAETNEVDLSPMGLIQLSRGGVSAELIRELQKLAAAADKD